MSRLSLRSEEPIDRDLFTLVDTFTSLSKKKRKSGTFIYYVIIVKARRRVIEHLTRYETDGETEGSP